MLVSADQSLHKMTAFGLVGIIGTGAHYLTLVALVEAVSIDPVVATTLGFVVGATINYILNHRYTFKSTKGHLDAGPKFFLIAIFTGLLNGLLVHVGIHWAGFNYLLTQVFATLVVFFVNYALNSVWTFCEQDVT